MQRTQYSGFLHINENFLRGANKRNTRWRLKVIWSMFWQKLISDIFQKMSFSYFSSYLLKLFYLSKKLSLFLIIFW